MTAFSRPALSRFLILYAALYAGFEVPRPTRRGAGSLQVRKTPGVANSGTPARSDQSTQSTMALVNSSFAGAPELELSVPA